MTRPHNEQYYCPDCKKWFTRETAFGRWIRNNKQLESKLGYCVVDSDYWVHRFKTHRGREIQCILMIEIKTMGAQLEIAQKDTLLQIDQVMKNRRQTPTKGIRWQAGNTVVREVFSIVAKRTISLRVYGVHLLSFSGLGPDDSDVIEWDHKRIDAEKLTSILRFDLDPNTLLPLDLRKHHPDSEPKQLKIPARIKTRRERRYACEAMTQKKITPSPASTE